MDKIVERSLLFDVYGNLLTDHQREIYEDVVNNDYSLSEIGEELGISRQGVHDQLKKIDKILLDYEEKLHYAENYRSNCETIEKIKSAVSKLKDDGIDVSEIAELLDKLTEDL